MRSLQKDHMHDVTDLVRANKTSPSLRTTVPRPLVLYLKLTEDDKIRWEYIFENGEIVGAKVTKEEKQE